MEKKLRFGELVRNSGRPQTVTLWVKPEKDAALARAIKQNRVLTVVQEPGKRDYGTIGFKLADRAVYLEFPRPLPREPDARVIGLNYMLIDEPTVPRAERANAAKPEPAEKRNRPARPTLRKFTIKIRRTARQDSDIIVKASDQDTAEQQALKRARQEPFKATKNDVSVEVMKTEWGLR